MSILNQRSIKNICLFWGAVLLIWVGVIAGTLWSKGYQHQSNRSFTDEEMIRIAIHRTIQRMQENPPLVIRVSSGGDPKEDKFFRPALVVPYRDVDHFLEENPDCCRIKKTDRLTTVHVGGKVFYLDKSGYIHVRETNVIGWQYFTHNIRYLP